MRRIMAQRSKKGSLLASLSSLPTDNASAEAACREALSFRDLGSNPRAASQKRLAQAHVTRDQAESEAITATKNYCTNTRVEADKRLQQADLTLTKAEEIRAYVLECAASMEEEIQFRLSDA